MIREKRYTVGRLEWEIPAGRVEDGESKEDAARREAMEETGCTLKDLLRENRTMDGVSMLTILFALEFYK